MRQSLTKNLSYIFISICLINFVSCGDSDLILNPPVIDPPFSDYVIDSEPAWSPDGSTIAFIGVYDGGNFALNMGLFLVDTNGSNKRTIYEVKGIPGNSSIGNPTWSPSGEWIAFEISRKIYKIKTNGDSLTQVTYDGLYDYPSWSPDGEWIAYDRGYSHPEPIELIGIWRVMQNGSSVQQIYSGFAGYPCWDNTSKNVFFFLRRTNVTNLVKYSVVNGTLDTLVKLTNPEFYGIRYLRVSSNNYSFTFTSQSNIDPNPNIWTVNSDGTGLKKLTTDGGRTSDISPDGERIVYCNSVKYNGRLWIMNKDGSGKRQLTFGDTL